MENYIFGIKCNGESIMVSEISIDDDRSNYDFICKALLARSYNGNGSYDVSIINKDYVRGMNVGKWRITQAGIVYNWGNSHSFFYMEDEDGNKTDKIIAYTQMGSKSGFSVPLLVKSIFTKAQSVVRDYPNAAVLNVVQDFYKTSRDISVRFLKEWCFTRNGKIDNDYLSSIEYAISKLSGLIGTYKKTEEVLNEQKDQRSKQLLKDITSECIQLLNGLRD